MKVYYVVNARLPSKKAYGIQIAKMCEAFIEAGVDLELVIPRTHAARSASMRQFYDLRVDVPTRTVWTPDWYDKGRIGYALSSLAFSLNLFFFFMRRKLSGERALYYSIPDLFSYTVARICGLQCVIEIHEPWQLRGGMRTAKKIIATNGEIALSLEQRGVPKERISIEPNGVDLSAYERLPSKEEARASLGIPADLQIALYAGRLYQWKGLEILVEAAKAAPNIAWYVVGGSAEEFRKAAGVTEVPENIHVAGEVAPADVPQWLAAADVLLILGTKHNEISYRYTAPMKVFEYMAAKRPVVASATPALKSIVGEHVMRFYEPDDANSLSEAVKDAMGESDNEMLDAANAAAAEHSWSVRASRIKAAIV